MKHVAFRSIHLFSPLNLMKYVSLHCNAMESIYRSLALLPFLSLAFKISNKRMIILLYFGPQFPSYSTYHRYPTSHILKLILGHVGTIFIAWLLLYELLFTGHTNLLKRTVKKMENTSIMFVFGAGKGVYSAVFAYSRKFIRIICVAEKLEPV